VEYLITVQPQGLRLSSSGDEDLLATLHGAGIEVESICGGMGTCGKCRIHILEGKVSEPTAQEKDYFSGEQLERGERLACQACPEGDLSIYIPASSLTSGQRLQLESELGVKDLEPAVRCHDLEVEIPDLPGDPGSDLERVLDALRATAPEAEVRHACLAALKGLPPTLRENRGVVRAVTRRGELLGLLARERSPLGVAVDLGSTKIAVFLYDLADGSLLSNRGFLNPQVPYGEDIITRIQFAMDKDPSLLGEVVARGIGDNLAAMCGESARWPEDIYETVLVGNTAMHHLFLGLPVAQLGMSPYIPATDLPLEVRAGELGLAFNPAGLVYLPPPIAGYVGSDHLAAVYAARLWERPEPSLLLDIGTNTEVALHAGGRMRCCSCASGPAFEGGGLSQGMRAAHGAIEDMVIDPASGEPELSIIGDAPPLGICGSGILSALAAMVQVGAIDAGGRMMEGTSRVDRRDGELAYYLALPDGESRDGVAITQNDVREIQKAKGAIRAGVDALLAEAEIIHTDLKEVILAGAFGTYIDPAAAIYISLLPPISPDIVNQVGNAAGAGARSMLLSERARSEAEGVARRLEYLELSSYPQLGKLFAADMYLSEEAVSAAKLRFKL
jgi:uncharacterized 2Fe-2S/4Fe-4S cluster protein (DUF4445 family)